LFPGDAGLQHAERLIGLLASTAIRHGGGLRPGCRPSLDTPGQVPFGRDPAIRQTPPPSRCTPTTAPPRPPPATLRIRAPGTPREPDPPPPCSSGRPGRRSAPSMPPPPRSSRSARRRIPGWCSRRMRFPRALHDFRHSAAVSHSYRRPVGMGAANVLRRASRFLPLNLGHVSPGPTLLVPHHHARPRRRPSPNSATPLLPGRKAPMTAPPPPRRFEFRSSPTTEPAHAAASPQHQSRPTATAPAFPCSGLHPAAVSPASGRPTRPSPTFRRATVSCFPGHSRGGETAQTPPARTRSQRALARPPFPVPPRALRQPRATPRHRPGSWQPCRRMPHPARQIAT